MRDVAKGLRAGLLLAYVAVCKARLGRRTWRRTLKRPVSCDMMCATDLEGPRCECDDCSVTLARLLLAHSTMRWKKKLFIDKRDPWQPRAPIQSAQG